MGDSSNYRMPAEWAEHNRCWMAWPCDEEQWVNGIQRARQAFANVASAIAEFEPVTIVCLPGHESSVRTLLEDKVDIFPLPLDDSWMRDMGPTFVFDQNGNKKGINWVFNGWGKFPSELDNKVAESILAKTGVESVNSKLVNEGGGIHVDGEGTVLLTETVQMNENRNPDWTKAQIEAELKHKIGATTCIWLPQGMVDDDTDGHIDELACFVAPGKVLALTTQDESDANYEIFKRNIEILSRSRDANGNLLDVVTIEQPAPQYNGDVRLSTSYINFYIANGGIVMPGYGDEKADKAAYAVVQSCFPEHKIVQLDCRDIVVGGGNIHCITQQEPK